MPALVVPFTKMNGAGNDFVVLDNRFLFFSDSELVALARRVCPRRTGVGADGLLALNAPAAPASEGGGEGAHFRMRYLNADGSWARMCGNGARCLARFARDAGLDAEPLVFDTDAGRYTAHVAADAGADVRLRVPPPRDFAARTLADGTAVHFIWTGTEHVVTFVDALDAAPVAARGAEIRHDPAFAPAGANANFVEVDPDAAHADVARLRVRTFEKGVEGETLACGTGALAAALVAYLTDRVSATSVDVVVPGGTLRVTFALGGDAVHHGVRDVALAGPAETVYQGTLSVDVASLAV